MNLDQSNYNKIKMSIQESNRIVSHGTSGWKRQPGSSYPEAYYGYDVPMENKFFKEYLTKKKVKMTHPLASGYAFSSSYAPVGGITETDIMQRCNLRRGCHPQLPARQNETSYILDSNSDFRLCPYGQKEDMGPIGEESSETFVTSAEELGITEEEMAAIDEELSIIAEEAETVSPKTIEKEVDATKPNPSVQMQVDSSIWFALGALIFLSFYFSRR